MNELTYYIDKYFTEKEQRKASSDDGYVRQPLPFKHPAQEDTNTVSH